MPASQRNYVSAVHILPWSSHTFIGPVFPHDDGHGADDLLGHRGRYTGSVRGAVRGVTQVVDHLLWTHGKNCEVVF